MDVLPNSLGISRFHIFFQMRVQLCKYCRHLVGSVECMGLQVDCFLFVRWVHDSERVFLKSEKLVYTVREDLGLFRNSLHLSHLVLGINKLIK